MESSSPVSERYSLLVDLYTDETRMFDLEADPGERWNIASSTPDVVLDLEEKLARHLEEMEARGGIAPELLPIGEERLDALKALGYTR